MMLLKWVVHARVADYIAAGWSVSSYLIGEDADAVLMSKERA